MKIIVAGGTGCIGRNLIAKLLERGMDIAVIGRDKRKIKKIYESRVEALEWSDLSSQKLSYYDAVINLAGQDISEKRWSKKFKECILDSRLDSTNALALLCSKLGVKSPRMLNASAVGVYGMTGQNPLQPIPVDESWKDISTIESSFLSDVARKWEEALAPAIANDVPVTIMRFGVVLKINEGMLGKLALSVKLGLAGKIGSGQQWMSWIHIDDLVSAIIFLLEHPDITGPINLTHPMPVTQSAFIHLLAKHYHRPCFFNMPAWLVKCLFGEMGEELLLGGQNVVPARLQQHGFIFSKKTISDAFM